MYHIFREAFVEKTYIFQNACFEYYMIEGVAIEMQKSIYLWGVYFKAAVGELHPDKLFYDNYFRCKGSKCRYVSEDSTEIKLIMKDQSEKKNQLSKFVSIFGPKPLRVNLAPDVNNCDYITGLNKKDRIWADKIWTENIP